MVLTNVHIANRFKCLINSAREQVPSKLKVEFRGRMRLEAGAREILPRDTGDVAAL